MGESGDAQVSLEKHPLEAHHPLKQIIFGSFGPFLAEFVGASYALVDTFWISKACGEDGMAAISLSSFMDTISRSFGFWISTAVSVQFSYLRGHSQADEIPHLFFDLLRIALCFALFVPFITIPLIHPVLKFFGASGTIMKDGADYLVVLLASVGVICMSHLFCGTLQSEGKMGLYGLVQMSAFLMNMLIFEPLFLLYFKLGLKGAAIGTVISESIPMLILAFFFLRGKMDSKVHWKRLFSKFNPNTWPAVKVGFTQFMSRFLFNIPSFFSRKYVGDIATKAGNYTEILAAWNVVLKVWYIPFSYSSALSMSYLPAASYAFGSGNGDRVIHLLLYGHLFSFIWCSLAEIGLIFGSDLIARIFSQDPDFRKTTNRLMFITYIFCALMGSETMTGVHLQSMKKSSQSLVFSFLTMFLPVPLFGSLLYFSDKTNDVFRLMRMYPYHDVFGFIVCILFSISPLRELMRMKSQFSLSSSPLISTKL